LASIRINGDYRVKLCRDINYGRPCEEINHSEANLDIRSLGEQFSSIEIMRNDGCDDDRAAGVFLYSERSQKGDCTYTRADIPDLGSRGVGDNRTSSIRINGDYKVTLFEYTNFQGRSEEVSSSDPNLDIRSLGEQYSSARVEKRVKCEDTTKPGIYLYSEKRYKGNCAYITADVADLDTTAVGNDGVRSLRIVGPFKVNLYEDRGFKGRSDEYSKDQDDLTWRSLGDQYSAARVRPRNQAPVLMLNQANDIAVTQNNQAIWSNQTTWIFSGVAQDSDGVVTGVDFNCAGDACNETRVTVSSAAAWSYTADGLVGKNRIYFHATDDAGARSGDGDRQSVELYIDTAPPATTVSFDGEAGPDQWPAWFTAPVTVRLSADDVGVGQARAGAAEVHYRLDGGAWQVVAGSEAGLVVGDDGAHTVDYYAVDRVGNPEAVQNTTFAIDRTPPSPPAEFQESHNACNGQWQRTVNTPVFQWAPASDATSGVWGYQFYFDVDPAGVSYQSFLAGDPLTWTPFPAGVRTGTYYLRGRTRDHAGNFSAWSDLCTFRFDGAPPANPGAATHAAPIASNTWQTTTAIAAFSWPPAYDEGSGLLGYQIYWGEDPAGASADLQQSNLLQRLDPLCAVGQACTGYLRLRSVDNVQNQAEDWTTAFVLRYDTAPPVAAFSIGSGVTETAQTLLSLDIAALDAGSGVEAMRLSHDGRTWTEWEPYAGQRLWRIPAISRQWWPVYLQVRDGVGLVSTVVSQTVYLDVNRQHPRSDSYRLFDYAVSAGGEAHVSAPSGYQVQSTLGQPAGAEPVGSAHFQLIGGYQAGSRAIPLVQPVHDEFEHVNGVLAAGVVTAALSSGAYRMIGTLGEVALPNNATTLSSDRYRVQPGFLAAEPATSPPQPEQPPSGATPAPTPAPLCAYPSVVVDNGAPFTNNANVMLHLCAPRAVAMKIGHEETFGDSVWQPYATVLPWTLDVSGQTVLPRFVYVLFKDADGTVHGTYMDDIIYDPNPPAGAILIGDSVPDSVPPQSAARGGRSGDSIATTTAPRIIGLQDLRPVSALARTATAEAPGAVDVFVNAQDDNSRLTAMQFSALEDFGEARWEVYSALKPWLPAGGDGFKTLYVRFRDTAGNISAAADASFILDTEPPTGGLYLYPQVAGPNTADVTVFLSAEDLLTGVADYRIGFTPDLADAVWLPYWGDILWPVDAYALAPATVFYVQYRDFAGNASPIYNATLWRDTEPPDLYVEVDNGDMVTRTVHLYAYDDLSIPQIMRVSSDVQTLDAAPWQALLHSFDWAFTPEQPGWLQIADSAGNVSTAFAFAAPNLAPPPQAALRVRLNIRQ